MKRKAAFQCSMYIVVLIGLSVFLAGCGSDSAAPTDPSTTSVIPDIVFFNTADPSAVILFEGRAIDNIRIQTVLISFNNGADWHTADIDNTPPNKLWNVEWFYLATATDIPATMNTVLLRALDGEDNEVTSSPIPLEKQSGSNVSDLEAVFSSATGGQVIALSSGIGGAYGNSSSGPTIPINVSLTVTGSGYGTQQTFGGYVPNGDTPATILEADPTQPSPLFSVDADLTLKNMRLLGAEFAIRISDSGGSDPQLSVQNCLFDRQSAWAVYAEDNDGGLSVEFASSVVDASRADSPSGGGGLYLDNVNYTITDSLFYRKSPAGPGAGVLAVGGAGLIDNSIFSENALAIWASGGSPIISSCNIKGFASTTSNGVLFTGDSFGTTMLIRNRILENKGYGVMISGDAPVIFEQNSISQNGSGGVVIDYNFTAISTLPVLGDCQAYNICDEGGRNSIFSNLPYDAIATANTGSEDVILAQGNFWGAGNIWDAHVDQVIQDGDTLPTTSRVPPLAELLEDIPNRAKLNFLPFDATGIDPNP